MKNTIKQAAGLVITIARADWSPHLESAAKAIAWVCCVVYVAGEAFGHWLHGLNDQLAGKPRRLAMRRVPMAPARQQEPQEGSDPMADAIAMVREGMAVARAARECGVSRTTLRRRLSVMS